MFDVDSVRAQFPALQRTLDGDRVVFADGPAGTQMPGVVIDAMCSYMSQGNSHLGGAFATSQRTGEVVAAARAAMADLLDADRPEEIVFGQNMTTLTLGVSRAIARTWQPGDEIVIAETNHDGNVAPWLLAAEERGVTVRWLESDPEDCGLLLERLPALLGDRTRLVAITYASNAVGTITDITRISELVRAAGALLYVDAVHYMPHGPVSVRDIGCDFLVCSLYKFFGPHLGALYGRYELLERLRPYNVRPAPPEPPWRWETGTPSFENLAGVPATIEYLAGSGGGDGARRARLKRAMESTRAYERSLSAHFLRSASRVSGLRIFGVTDTDRLDERTPTFAVRLDGYTPREVAEALANEGIFVWNGHYYSPGLMQRLKVHDSGGVVRIGFVHYNEIGEVDRVVSALKRLSDTTC